MLNKDNSNPISIIRNSFLLWMIYLIFCKQFLQGTCIIMTILLLLYITKSYISYYSNNSEDQHRVSKLLEVEKILVYILVLVMCIGFILYGIHQYNDHKDFSIISFIFGKLECDSIK